LQRFAPALAQTADSPQDDGALQTIVVTAERRTQSLQDVPISATVLSGEDLQRKGVSNLNDMQQVAPSVAINTFNRSTFINIRGVGIAQSAPTSNPGVAYYIDGQLIPHEQFIGQSFFDIGSIEVLRGPQGTLTGQNSTGGAVYVRTPEPEFGSNFAVGDFTAGNYDRYRAVVAANIGGEDVALRVAYVHEQRDSYTRNIAANALSQPGNLNMDAIRANLRLRGMDGKLNVNVRGEYFDVRTDNNAVKNRNDAVSSNPFVIEEDAPRSRTRPATGFRPRRATTWPTPCRRAGSFRGRTASRTTRPTATAPQPRCRFRPTCRQPAPTPRASRAGSATAIRASRR
jgi:iron complex outermembrane receptor protein